MRIPLLRVLLLLITPCLAWAQLVQAPPSQPQKRARPTVTTGPKAAARPTEPDLNDKLSLPKRFAGAVIDKKSGRIILSVIGTWGPSPEIQGSSSAVAYSKRAAKLSDFMNRDDTSTYLYSFNVGQKNGRLLVRTFKWPKREYGLENPSPVVQEDEGEGSFVNGRMEFETEKHRLVFQGASEGNWMPKEANLFRWSASDVQGSHRPFSLNLESFPSQYVPTWGGGSYLILSDGFMGCLYYRYFAGSTTFILPTITLGSEVVLGDPRHFDGQKIVNGGGERLSELWQEGLRDYGQEPYQREVATRFQFGKGWSLQSVIQVGEDSGVTSFDSVLAGNAESVALEESVKGEILDRAREKEWPLSAGPYSLRRTLLRAFKGCDLVAPRKPLKTANGFMTSSFNQHTDQTWQSALALWREEADAAGATLTVLASTDSTSVQRPFSLGWVLPSGKTVASLKEEAQTSRLKNLASVPAKIRLSSAALRTSSMGSGGTMGAIGVGMEWLKDSGDDNCKKYKGKLEVVLPPGVSLYRQEFSNRASIEDGKICIVWWNYFLVAKNPGKYHFIFKSNELPGVKMECDFEF